MLWTGSLGADGASCQDSPSKQGPNSQLEGLRRRRVALMDQIPQIALGRTDGKKEISLEQNMPLALSPHRPLSVLCWFCLQRNALEALPGSSRPDRLQLFSL